MKSYVTSGTGSQQTLTGSQDEKVAIYQTLADAEADLANLEAGQIVATPDTGDENAQPVDVIQAGNMHAVTSNAVADKINSLDVASVGGSGKYISAISETDGKINATASDLVIPITSSVDLNTMVQVGTYATASDVIGNGCTNVPVNSPATFFLNVYKSGNSTVMQIFTDSFLNRYMRNSYNGGQTWNTWQKVIKDTDLDVKADVSSSYNSDVYTLLTAIGVNDYWARIGIKTLADNIANYSSGVVQVSTDGGPVFHFVLAKYNNDYWQAEFMSYSRYYHSIIRITKNENVYYGVKFN